MSRKHLSTKERNFRKLAAYIRILETVICETESTMRNFITKDERAYLRRMWNAMEMLRACAEDHLWETCGFDEADPANLFYGGLGAEPIDAVDAEVVSKAKEIAANLFRLKPDTRKLDDDGLPAIESIGDLMQRYGIETPEQHMKRPLTRYQAEAEEWARCNGGRDGDD